jgi:hypothetical protein
MTLAQLAAHLEAVLAGQHHIEQDQIESAFPGTAACGDPVAENLHVVALEPADRKEANGGEAARNQDRASSSDAPTVLAGRRVGAEGCTGIIPIPRDTGQFEAA